MKLSEAIYNGLTNLGDSIERTNKVKRDYKLESIKLGLIPDHEKLHMLKQQLYRDSRTGKDTEQLRKTIKLLRNEVTIKNKAQAKSTANIAYTLNQFLNLLIIFGGLYWFANQIQTKCPRIDSEFCNQFHRNVDRYFNGERKSNLLPSNVEGK